MSEDFGGQDFVHEDTPVLRVILKLDDVTFAVVGFQQMRLRTASHFSDEPVRVYGHVLAGSANPLPRRILLHARGNEVRGRQGQRSREEPG